MFTPRLALASLSGQSDADWARAGLPHAGAAFLGGIAVDAASIDAARRMVADRDREEFLPADPLAFVDRQLELLADAPLQAGYNVRSATPEPIERAAEICRARGAIVEVNAHCRQAELCAVGCGESLLQDRARLVEQVAAAASAGATVGVKVRTEVPGVDLPALAPELAAAGADLLHVDAMDSEPVVGEIASAAGDDLFVIANNGVRDRATTREYLDLDADAVSVGRPSDNPAVLRRVRAAVEAWRDEHGAVPAGSGVGRP